MITTLTIALVVALGGLILWLFPVAIRRLLDVISGEDR